MENNPKRRALALAGIVTVALTAAACGGGSSSSSSSSAAAPATTAAAAPATTEAAPATTEAASTEAASTEAASTEAASTDTTSTEAASTEAATSAPATSTPDPNSGKGIKLGFIQLFNEPYALQIAAGVKAAAAEYGATVTVTGPDSLNPTTAISDFQNVVASGAKGVIVMAYPEELWKKPFQVATGQGVAVGTVDISSEAGGAATHTGSPRQQMGAALADEFAKDLGASASGEIVAGLCVPGLAQLTSPIDGFTTQMKKLDPNIKVTVVATAGDPAGNFAAWQRIVAQHPDALGFVGPCDQDLPSLVKVKQQNPNSKWLSAITSGGENPIASPSIQSGLLTAATSARGFVAGYVAGKHMMELLVNKVPTPKGWIDTGFDTMTKDNSVDVAKALSSTAAAASYYQGLIAKLILPTVTTIEPSDNQQTVFDEPRPAHDGSNVN